MVKGKCVTLSLLLFISYQTIASPWLQKENSVEVIYSLESSDSYSRKQSNISYSYYWKIENIIAKLEEEKLLVDQKLSLTKEAKLNRKIEIENSIKSCRALQNKLIAYNKTSHSMLLAYGISNNLNCTIALSYNTQRQFSRNSYSPKSLELGLKFKAWQHGNHIISLSPFVTYHKNPMDDRVSLGLQALLGTSKEYKNFNRFTYVEFSHSSELESLKKEIKYGICQGFFIKNYNYYLIFQSFCYKRNRNTNHSLFVYSFRNQASIAKKLAWIKSAEVTTQLGYFKEHNSKGRILNQGVMVSLWLQI